MNLRETLFCFQDPYAYFSDVWQENKAQKPPTTNKSYPSESAYSRDSYSSYGNKYAKSESTWEHRDSYEEVEFFFPPNSLFGHITKLLFKLFKEKKMIFFAIVCPND